MNVVIQRISFPAFSRVQDDAPRLRQGYLEALRYSSLIAVPPTIGLALVAGEFVNVVLSSKWNEAIPIIQILAIYAAVNAMGGPLWGQVLKAKGRVNLLLAMSVVRVVALPAAILAGSLWGLVGICTGIAIYAVIFRLVYQAVINRYLQMTMRDFFVAIAPSLTSSAVMTAAVAAVAMILIGYAASPLISLLVKSIVGACACVGALLAFARRDLLVVWNSIVPSPYHIRATKHGRGAA